MTTSQTDDIGTIARIPRRRIRRFSAQPRRFFDPTKLEELASSIGAEGQKTPVKVRPVSGDVEHDYELVDGERRLLACGLAKVDTMLAWICDVANEEEQFIDAVVANFGREGHTPLETARAIVKIMGGRRMATMNRTAQMEHAAKLFARSPAWVYLYLNLLNLHPEVQAMLEPDAPEGKRLAFSVATFLNNIRDQELQLQVATELAAKRLKTNAARAFVRKMLGKDGGQHPTHPSDHFRVLETFVDRLATDAERVLDMPFRDFGTVLSRRTLLERDTMLEKIDSSIEQLQQIRQALAKANDCAGK
jgi:ParB/RepB/Spo0J family partition protein